MSKRDGRYGKNKKVRTHRKDYDHDNAKEDDIIEFEDGFSRIRDAKGRWKKVEEGSDDEIEVSDDYDDDDTDKFASAKAVYNLKQYVDNLNHAAVVIPQTYYQQSTTPEGVADGTSWFDTENETLYQKQTGSWVQLSTAASPTILIYDINDVVLNDG